MKASGLCNSSLGSLCITWQTQGVWAHSPDGALHEAEGKKQQKNPTPCMRHRISADIRNSMVSNKKMQVLGDWRVSPSIACLAQYSV